MMPLLNLPLHIYQVLDWNLVGRYFSVLPDHRQKQSLFNWMSKNVKGSLMTH